MPETVTAVISSGTIYESVMPTTTPSEVVSITVALYAPIFAETEGYPSPSTLREETPALF